ncbi:site-specific integrase [Mucilaginibacter sp. Mucisp84]|uniref:site-specific integrase n=1 Tax=Mucilaginibacter sp. Mucisp84 TaxID=3243058 RepID=UPI0039A5AE16
MATVSPKVLKHHLKTDGSYNVKIRIFHKGEKRYIDTNHYVSDKQLSKDLAIKDPFINRQLNKQIDEYRIAISELGERLDFFSAEALRDYLISKNEEVNFVNFCDAHIRQLKKDGRSGTASNHTSVRNSLVDYFGREKVSVMEISTFMLKSYERFLRSKRIIKRINQFGKEVTTDCKGVTDSGVYNYMRDLRTLFNAAREKYNNEDLGIIKIPHYPFAKYKVGSPPQTQKRNVPLKVIKSIRSCQLKPDGRAELARDLFMLSFYMCGINAVDLYNCTEENIKNGRLEYHRSKTKVRRKDNAFISIKIVDEAKPLLKKYLGKLTLRYANFKHLDSALSKGMKQVSEQPGIPPVTFYGARHSFANVARNDCRMSKDDIALALNHIDHTHTTTDIYLSRDWKIVDDVQSKVIDRLRKIDKKGKTGVEAS